MPSDQPADNTPALTIESISAVTLFTPDIAASIGFYRSLGFEKLYGGEGEPLTSFRVGTGFLNLIHTVEWDRTKSWGRTIIYVSDVDAMFKRCIDNGWTPSTEPTDAAWGERYFHISDPAGHEISFARPISSDRPNAIP